MRLVSILGDSISTFEGYNPPGYLVFYDQEMQVKNGLTCVYDTWWAKVNQKLHAYLCVNNAYSGSKVSGNSFPATSGSERIDLLCKGDMNPDYILLYIGFNDFGNGVQIEGNNEMAGDVSSFTEAYRLMLMRLKNKYSESKIICATLMRTLVKNQENWVFPEYYKGVAFEEYNDVIRNVSVQCGCDLADLGRMNIRYETLDGSHPTALGHTTIANAWINALNEMGLIKPSLEMYIKAFQIDSNSDEAVYMVFKTLTEERVLIPYNGSNRALVGLPYQGQTIIPLFTSFNEISQNEPVSLKLAYIQDVLPALLEAKKNIIINPFSSPEKLFFLPYKAIEKMLIPLLKSKE